MTPSHAHAFARNDRSRLGVWWWTTDRWLLGAVGALIALGVILLVAILAQEHGLRERLVLRGLLRAEIVRLHHHVAAAMDAAIKKIAGDPAAAPGSAKGAPMAGCDSTRRMSAIVPAGVTTPIAANSARAASTCGRCAAGTLGSGRGHRGDHASSIGRERPSRWGVQLFNQSLLAHRYGRLRTQVNDLVGVRGPFISGGPN